MDINDGATTPGKDRIKELKSVAIQASQDDVSHHIQPPNLATDQVRNELLCFVSNKIEMLPYEMICKLCTDSYSDAEIEEAKDVLFETAFSDESKPRKIKRRGAGKKQSDIQDIVNIFLEMSPTVVPCYVAHDLSKHPPLTVDSFDMAKIIKDIESLKLKVSILQEAQEASLIANLALADQGLNKVSPASEKADAPPIPVMEKSNPPAAPATTQDTAPSTSATDVCDGLNESLATEDALLGNTDAQALDNTTLKACTESEENDLLRLAKIQDIQAKPSYAQITRRNTISHSCSKPQRRQPIANNPQPGSYQRQDNVITGKGRNFAIRSASRSKNRSQSQSQQTSTGIFVSRLARSTQPNEVVQHIEREIGVRCHCQPLQTKHDSYRSFLIRAPRNLRRKILNPMAWPAGVLVREYFEKK